MNDNEDIESLSSATREGREYVLRLYVAGISPMSLKAITTVKEICETYLKHFDLQIIDIYKQPQLAQKEQIIAVPVLIKKLPLPERKLIGNLSEKEKVLVGLDIKWEESNLAGL